MPDQVVRLATPAAVVRAIRAADSLEEFGRRARRDLERREKGLADEGLRIDRSNCTKARAIRQAATDAVFAHPEWADEVAATLKAAKKRSEDAA